MKSYIYVLMIIGAALQGLFVITEKNKKYVAADVLKGSASLFFVLIGYLACKANPTGFSKKILIGLVFGMIGDILLNLRFVFEKNGQKFFLTGIVAFLIGHVLYLLAIIPNAVHLALCVAVGVILAASLLTYIFKTMDVKPAFKIFGIFYLGAIIIMTTIAVVIAIFRPDTAGVIFAVGAVLFTASDIVLIFNTFSGTSRFSMRVTNLTLYYIGQILIACSLFFVK
ncbi:MAG: lysoplasmalogenase [Erysipelotrichaceae bacterium]|nr:lysoplasmalogenase [Erysipelotrichaceae bacterium]